MKIYVAARTTQQREARAIAIQLTTLGHEVTSGWLAQADLDNPVRFRTEAERDLADLDAAEAILILTTVVAGGKGMWVEFGYALAKGLKIYTYPHIDSGCVFMALPQVKSIVSLVQIPQQAAYPHS